MKNTLDRDLVKDLFAAYFDARRNKRNTVNQLAFEMDFEHSLFELASEIQNRTYKVGRSICFIVNNPVKREIFAADFRDRVVHHLVFNWTNQLFERKLIRDCYSCRKGLGTSFGVERLQHNMRSVTDNHTRDAYVLKLDIQGYFMSISRPLLWSIVEKVLLQARNKGQVRRIDDAMFLLREVIYNDPTENCYIKGVRKEWEGLPPSKSLFYSAPGCGLPIGNLTSQMFSNVYLLGFDNWVKRELKMKYYGRYVDDFYFMHRDKDVLVKVKDRVTDYLKEHYGLVVHPNKVYLQHISHGVTFLGAHIKPYRTYVRSRSLGIIRNNLRMNDLALQRNDSPAPATDELYRLRSRFNSYLGHLAQFKTYRLRKELWEQCSGHRKYFRVNTNFKKISVRSQYLPYVEEPLDDGLDGLFPEL